MAAAAIVTLLVVHCVSLSVSEPISSPFPVQKTEPGIRYKPVDPPPKVKLEIFIALTCPYSKDALPVVKNVTDHYGSNKLNLVVHQLPLPYHRNAFLEAQGLYVIRDNVNSRMFEYMEAVLNSYSQFTTTNTKNLTETQVLSMLADVAVTSTGINRDLFINTINNYRTETTGVWKFATSNMQSGTPQYVVNGIELINADPTYDDWIVFLDPIINAKYSTT